MVLYNMSVAGVRVVEFSTCPEPDTSLHCETTDTELVYRVVCLFTPQLSLVLTAPAHGGMAMLS